MNLIKSWQRNIDHFLSQISCSTQKVLIEHLKKEYLTIQNIMKNLKIMMGSKLIRINIFSTLERKIQKDPQMDMDLYLMIQETGFMNHILTMEKNLDYQDTSLNSQQKLQFIKMTRRMDYLLKQRIMRKLKSFSKKIK